MFYNGKCRDLFEDGACGEDLGKRLYLGEDGEAYCDCMDGWFPIDGKCYQHLTFAPEFCKNENEIIKWKIHKAILFEEPTQEEKHQYENNYVCEENLCSPGYLPHVSTWKERKCHKVPEGNLNCELMVALDSENDKAPLFCCYPEERSQCIRDTFLQIHSLFLTKVNLFHLFIN